MVWTRRISFHFIDVASTRSLLWRRGGTKLFPTTQQSTARKCYIYPATGHQKPIHNGPVTQIRCWPVPVDHRVAGVNTVWRSEVP
jgi:hypothetical protein